MKTGVLMRLGIRVSLCLVLALAAFATGRGQALADAADLIEYSPNPIYDPAGHRAYYPSVIYDPAGFSGHGASCYYKMWYGGYGSEPGAAHNEAVTYSDDGKSWSAPVELQGIQSGGYHAKVVYVPEGYGAGPYYYKIWYWTGVMDYRIENMRTADSADGVNWVNDQAVSQNPSHPLVTGTWPDWNRGTYGPVSVLYNPGASNSGGNPFDYSFTMYFDGTTGGVQVIGLAYSADGNYWTRYGDAPVLGLGAPGEWDSNYVTSGEVLRDGSGQWHLWYSGGVSAAHEGIGHAVSADGITWTKDAANPIFHVSDGVPWRNVRTYTPSVLYSPTGFDGHGDAASFKMWFNGRTNTPVENYAIGYAFSPYAQLVLDKTASPPGAVNRGSVITYTLRLRNDGYLSSTGTAITDGPPGYTSYVSGSTTLNGTPVPDIGGASPLVSGMAVNSPGEPPGIIAPGEEAVATLTVQVGDDLPLGASVRNVARATADGLETVEASCVNTSSSQLPTTWYFAEGSTQPGFDEYLLLSNMEGDAVQASVTFLNEGGRESSFPVEVPAHSRVTVYANSLVPGESGVAAIVQGNGGFVCERALYYRHRGILGGDAALGVNAPSLDLFFAEGFTGTPGSPFEEWICLLNPDTSPAEVTVDYLFPGGAHTSRTYHVPGRRRASISVDAELSEGKEVSAHLRSDRAVVAERAMYFRYNNVWDGGHTGKAATGARTDWYLAEGYTGWAGSRFDTWILVSNQESRETSVSVTYMFPDGSTREVRHSVPSMGRLTISADKDVGEEKMISAHVHADLPVVVERAMYFDYRNTWRGGHNSLAAAAPAQEFYFAEGYTGNPGSLFQTWLLIQNTAAGRKPVRVEYVLRGGGVIPQDLVLEPHSRNTVYANDFLRTPSLEFSIRVTCLDGSPSILAERAMYFDYGGPMGRSQGGHNIVGY
ncbi:MAG: DUF11 domain-containing protein [Actinobacteria bacterium]|nr:DUF11 domain-containing protein [Actinomycetota bacterium]